jgi:hypothetical protein
MHTVLLVAKILSAAALLALAAALLNLWRRSGVPALSYGSLTLSQRRLKAVWAGLLLGALAVGSNNDPILRYTDDIEGPAVVVPGSNTTYSLSIPLPFYRYERTSRFMGGTMTEQHVLEGLVLPWSFLWALLAYFVLVVRWNPESRLARRILEGRTTRES